MGKKPPFFFPVLSALHLPSLRLGSSGFKALQGSANKELAGFL